METSIIICLIVAGLWLLTRNSRPADSWNNPDRDWYDEINRW